MRAINPYAILGLLLLAAAITLGAGLRFARRDQTVLIARDRAPVHAFAAAMQDELQRLDRLYERHLREIADPNPDTRDFAVRSRGSRIVGVRQWSLVQREAGEDRHVRITNPDGASLPAPSFRENSSGIARSRLVLIPEEIFGENAEPSGWIDEPGKPTAYWVRQSNFTVVVLLIDAAEVRSVIDQWMRNWVEQNLEPLRATGGFDEIRDPGGQVVAATDSSVGERSTAPSLILPLRTRFGTWSVASSDGIETRTSYALPMIATAAVLAAALVVVAFASFAQQRRAVRLAAQRVSFVNRVSHELRAPMTNMLLNLDLAEEAGESKDEVAPRLRLVREEAQRLGRMIENVLTFSRGEQGRLDVHAQACRPDQLLRAMVDQFAAGLDRRGVSVRIEPEAPDACFIDPDALAQIIANLLSNVEKYAPGAPVTLSTKWAKDELQIRISDGGPGIPAHARERIFQPFERLDHRVTEGVSGTGLGLSIARELATRMGGELRLLPSAAGATFELRIPAPPAGPISSISAA